ncbi:MAG: HU family DNA-binding protein [Planctomycetota bacterium]
MAKKTGPKPPTKSEIMNNIAEATGHSKKGGPGQFTIPGLCKVVVQDKPALPKREVRHPGTGETVWAKPRPAKKVVKVRPLKGLTDMVM